MLLVLTLFQSAYADNIGGSAQFVWRSNSRTTDDGKEKSQSLAQAYNLGLNKELTSKVSFSADVGINATEINDSEAVDTKTTRLFPTFRLNMTNDYFDANGGYHLTERGLEIFGMPSDETRLTDEAWNANLRTKPTKYPTILFRFEERKKYDHLSIHETDTRSELYDTSADYTYKWLNFRARYSDDTVDNFVADTMQTTTTKEGTVDFRKSFWSNRLSSSGNYRWTERETERVTRELDFRFRTDPRDRDTGLYDRDTTPIIDSLTNTPLLKDDDISTSTGINIGTGVNNDFQNIGAELTSPEEVEEIWIYTNIEYDDNTNNPVQWNVYSSGDGTTWNLIEANATSEYIESEKRFEISFTPTTADFFKVVNTTKASVSDLYVTEIKLFGYITRAAYTTDSTTQTTQNILFNAGLKPVDWGAITYNFTQAETETDPNSRITRHYTHNINVRADADLHRYLKATAQYHGLFENASGSDRRSTDTYSLLFDSSPIDTLGANLSLSHSVPTIASVTQSRTTYSLLHIIAKLHEGVDLNTDGTLSYTENLINDTETFTRSIYSDLRLKLTKTLTTELWYTKSWTDTDNSDGTETSARNSTIRTDLFYRPVRNFYFRWTYTTDRNNGEKGPTSNEYSVNWVMTQKLRLTMDYNIRRNHPGTSATYSSDLAWNLSKIFVLRFEYNWSREKADTVTKSQMFTSVLSARF